GAATKEGRKHHPDDLAQQFLLPPEAPFDLGHEVVRQPQVIEGLLEGLSGVLRLTAITLQTLLRRALTAPSGLGGFFRGSCAWGHDVLLCFVRGSAAGRLSTHA